MELGPPVVLFYPFLGEGSTTENGHPRSDLYCRKGSFPWKRRNQAPDLPDSAGRLSSGEVDQLEVLLGALQGQWQVALAVLSDMEAMGARVPRDARDFRGVWPV